MEIRRVPGQLAFDPKTIETERGRLFLNLMRKNKPKRICFEVFSRIAFQDSSENSVLGTEAEVKTIKRRSFKFWIKFIHSGNRFCCQWRYQY